jgi:DNA polymerase-1
MLEPITIDFETDAIVGNPIINPPRTVGAAVWVPGSEPVYLAWGHPGDGNNISFHDAHQYLRKLRDSKKPLLFHNASFDLSVWNYSFCNANLNWLWEWERIHDTMFLLFLADPYAPSYSLKPSADRYLDMAPEEQDTLRDWILQNIPEATAKNWGAYISRAPVDLVAPYAIGDVVRTRKLFDLLHARISDLGMREAYDRERKTIPTLVDGTQRGIRIDRHTLEHHSGVYHRALQVADDRVRSLIGYSGAIGANAAFSEALERSGAVTEFVLTKMGKKSMAAGNLKISRPDVKELYEYRSALKTCLTTFIDPWLEFSEADGRVHPNWNSVRQVASDHSSKGTRTGRLSSDKPNFQNVPSEFTDGLGRLLPIPEGLPPLPIMRRYCLPEEGHVWIKRDFSSQEIRILAHFEDGSLCEAYRANPDLDPHRMAQELILSLIGVEYVRKDVKITGFSIIYGTGASGLSIQLGRSYEEAYAIKEAYLTAMPGVRTLMQDIQRRGKSNQPIRTWGGRIYYVEPPKVIDGRLRDFAYKMLNYLIQGSAADQTKQAICDWEDTRKWADTFLATVHDEINLSVPEETWQSSMETLEKAMDKDRFDVPFRSEGYVGKNWADLEKVK